MMRLGLILLMLFGSSAQAAYTGATPRIVVGVDTAMPYTIAVDGDAINSRNNFNVGIDSRYFLSDSVNVGGRFAFDVEQQPGTAQHLSFAPGIQYQWFQGRTWMPYVRSDLPYVFRGGTAPISNTQDLGLGVGSGIAWNLGNQIGIDHLVFRYDFNFTFFFGIADAINAFNLEFFRFGVDYRF